MAPAFRMSDYNDNIEQETKWWNDYPIRKYTDFCRPQGTFDNYIHDVWNKPKSLMRSASYTNLTYVKEAVHELPIRRSPSISSLAPSLSLPYDFRVPSRIVDRQLVYTPDQDKWYRKAYAPYHYEDTLQSIRRPLQKLHPSIEHSSHVPYYTFQTRRVFFEQRRQPSYMRGSQQYLDKYVSARLKADDFAQRFVHSAYEWRRPQDYNFNRHMMWGSQVSMPLSAGSPRVHNNNPARNVRHDYKINQRFYF